MVGSLGDLTYYKVHACLAAYMNSTGCTAVRPTCKVNGIGGTLTSNDIQIHDNFQI